MSNQPRDKKKILITGGSGFIGRNLIEQLGPSYELLAPASKELNLLDEEQVRDYLVKHNVDTVLHLAQHDAKRNSTRDQTLVLQNNLLMFLNLANCHELYRRMICLSSGRAYDQRHYMPRMPESYLGQHVPLDPYGLSKFIMAKYIENTSNIFELRVFGCFGKYEDWEIRFVSYACCKALFDQAIKIHQNRRMNYISVDDLIRVLTLFVEKEELAYKAYNICADTEIDLVGVVQRVLTIAKKNLPITLANPDQGKEYSGDSERFKAEFPEFRFDSLDQSIEQLFHWYQENKHLIDPQLLLLNK